MKRPTVAGWLLAIALAVFATFIALGYVVDVRAYTLDNITFAVVAVILFLLWERWHITPAIYALVILSMAAHAAGVFGWYANSPVGIDWDHITHFGLFPWTMLFWRALEQRITRRGALAIVCIGLTFGLGSVIELTEFGGYLVNGFGEGAFAFGAGDGFPGSDAPQDEVISFVGGGWINTGWDLVWNSIGAIFGILLMWCCPASKAENI